MIYKGIKNLISNKRKLVLDYGAANGIDEEGFKSTYNKENATEKITNMTIPMIAITICKK